MESVDVIRVSELLKRSKPCTAACSLHYASSIRPPVRLGSAPVTVDSDFGFGECEQDSNFSILEVLDRRAVLIGRVVLPTEDVLKSCKCPCGKSCLVFLDGDVGICCDILSFDVGLVRKEIRVVAWNYIPFKGNGGFLEIISWEFSDSVNSWMRPCSRVSSLQLEPTDSVDCVDDPKERYFVHGFVEAVSPVKGQRIGDKESDTMTSLRGFLVDIMSCQCKLCKLKDSEVVFCSVSKTGSLGHCHDKCATVYFSGSMSSLHPVMTKLAGHFVFLSCLRKKMVFIGKKECQLMYMITRKSILRVMKLINWQPMNKNMAIQGKGEGGVYTGLIKGIYMQGMIMELDREVWLLLADRSASCLHSLRVGALITVQNVHFVKCKFPWTKKLILGGCVRTVTNVQRFSPLTTSVCTSSQSANQLGKFIESLTFSARLWVLLVIAAFRKKFDGILSDKEILGSKHSKGLAQAYASSHLPYSKSHSQNGVFMDFCHHVSNECAREENTAHLKLVLTISNFIHQFGYSHPRKYTSFPMLVYAGSNRVPVKKIISSEDINVVLIGRLQISSSTRQLQLIDATGSIDIVIQDLPSTLNAQNIYEVNGYKLILEDLPARVDASVLRNKLFSFRHILQYFPPSKVDLAGYVLCDMANVNVINHSNGWDTSLNEVGNDTFDLLKLTHKFPMLQNVDSAISGNTSMFAEVIVLPWSLHLDPCCSYSNSSKDCDNGRAEVIKCIECESEQEASYNKRRKCENVPQKGLSSSFKKINGNIPKAANLENFVFVPCIKSSMLQTCDSSYPVQLPCSIHIRSGESRSKVLPGLLNCVKSDLVKGGSITANAHKVLLEFKFDNALDFEALQIGGYYILKNEKEESCKISKDNSSTKVVITPERKIWSFSLVDDDCLNKFSLDDASLMDSYNDGIDIYSKEHCQTEILLRRPNVGCSRSRSNVELHLSSKFRSLFEGYSRDFQGGSLKSLLASHKISSSLPLGKLISFQGHVMSVDTSDQGSIPGISSFETFGNFDHMKYHLKSSTLSRICVLTSNDIVRVLTCTCVHSFPVGFAPGVYAHFHRILQSRGDEYLLTPVSFVEIICIRASNKHSSYENSSFSRIPKSSKISTSDTVTSSLICQMMHCADSGPKWIRCRVLAIYILVFEKNDRNRKYLKCNIADDPDIPLAGFILDDGSATCCCWANADKAAALLKMHEEVPWQAVKSRCRTESTAKCSTAANRLNEILQKHGRITVKNYGSIYESSGSDFIISITTPKILGKSEEEMVECLVYNACVGKPMNVLGSVMDLDDVKRLEKHLTEMEMTLPPITNIWAIEVCFPNPLDEARDLIKNLL